MGNDSPSLCFRQEQAVVQLLQAVVRTGNQPADRPDPRSGGHVAGLLHWPASKPASISTRSTADASRSGAQPVLDFNDMRVCVPSRSTQVASSVLYEIDITYPASWGNEDVEARLALLCAEAVEAIRSGNNILIISDRRMDCDNIAIPALLALSAIHHHLVRKGLRRLVWWLKRYCPEVHHFAVGRLRWYHHGNALD